MQGPETEVYVLPPNTEISELQALDLKTNMLEVQEVLQRQVIQFFQMTSQPDVNQSVNGRNCSVRLR